MRDADGLAVGGLRHPFVQVPVALNRSTQEDRINWGTYRPWSDEQVRSRYPTHADCVGKVKAWTDLEVSKGWLLREDRDDAAAEAEAFQAPW